MSQEYSGDDRRQVDPIQEKIEELIMQAGDPKDKAMLMILNRIATNLDENTHLTRGLTRSFKAHTEAFELHERTEMALINQGRGFYKSAIASLFLLQALGAFWIKGHLEENARTRRDVDQMLIQIAEHQVKHENLKKMVESLDRKGP